MVTNTLDQHIACFEKLYLLTSHFKQHFLDSDAQTIDMFIMKRNYLFDVFNKFDRKINGNHYPPETFKHYQTRLYQIFLQLGILDREIAELYISDNFKIKQEIKKTSFFCKTIQNYRSSKANNLRSYTI